MLHGILRFDGHPSVIIGFLRNIEGMVPHRDICDMQARFKLGMFQNIPPPILLLQGAKPSDSKNELSLQTFLVINETDRSGDVEGLVLVFSRPFFSSSLIFTGSSFWESLYCLGWIMMVLSELWIWVEHCRSLVGYERVDKTEFMMLMFSFGFLTVSLDCQDIVAEFCDSSRWKELSKETSSKILPCGDGSFWKTFKPIASLIAQGKLK
nr:hypothetical protein [Tanacetum cinerariifolium]